MPNTLIATVTVPATTANIGPGFDCLGAALSLYNRFQFTPLCTENRSKSDRVIIHASGQGADQLPTDSRNLVYRAFVAAYQHFEQTPPDVRIDIHLDIPQARGLGSSATAIVAGLLGANELANRPLGESELLQLAIALEGHPDNVVPAMIGGCCLATQDQSSQQWVICPIDWSENIIPIVAIPDFELKTDLARNVLPKTCSYEDAIFNAAHVGLLIKGLEQGKPTLLQTALQDKLHQPYRQQLIPGLTEVYESALSAGAHGLVISGAGPTLLALSDLHHADKIAKAIQLRWQETGIAAKISILNIDKQGATVHS
ncbi:MAG: homoserine kinase [Acaryochloris sp. RU_4_1]|nr:homoserine kinase [Acaryochloris sp. RU_4_1]NJN39265.1 homoserine kinase [Acaryochloridaceae cyanobacterium CSU_3_4]NJR57117.1 homoserine kinase [Acaryochloris sp. CRU_2_0]